MTPATNWAPAVIVLVAALAVGLAFALRTRRGAPLPPAGRTRRDELLLQRDALYGLLREHKALEGTVGAAEWAAERDRLELEAARVLRDLAHADRLASGDAAPAPSSTAPTFGQRHPQLVGALWGAGAVAFVGAIVLTLQEYAAPRGEGGSMTGNNGGGGGMEGGGGEAALSPAQEAHLAQLRAVVDATPDDADARNRLGHALLHAGKLMDSFKEAEAVVKLRPDDPEARTHQAIVLIAIGDTTTAESALDKVIADAPTLAEALAYRGALHFQAGQAADAVALLERAVAADPALLESVQPLIDAAKSGKMPARAMAASDGGAAPAGGQATGGAPAGGPMSGGGAVSGPARTPVADDVTGTITVDAAFAATVKPGDSLFLSARPPGVDRGPPTWVQRHAVDTLPLTFTLGPTDAMIKGGPAPTELVITARIDRDGNAMTKGPDDLEGKSSPLAPGARDVTITLAAPK